MGDWPKIIAKSAFPLELINAVPNSASNNVKGAWAQLVASANYDGILSVAIEMAAQAGGVLIDIGVGAAGSEVVIFSGLHAASGATSNANHITGIIPVLIKRGQRVAVRKQSTVAAQYCAFRSVLIPCGAVTGFDTCQTLGQDVSDSGGLVVDPGATTGSFGSWVQFTAGLPRAAKCLLIALGQRGNTSPALAIFTFQVSVTANYMIVVEGFALSSNIFGVLMPVLHGPYTVDLPAGQPVYVRMAASTNDATDRLLDAVLYCFS